MAPKQVKGQEEALLASVWYFSPLTLMAASSLWVNDAIFVPLSIEAPFVGGREACRPQFDRLVFAVLMCFLFHA